MTMDFDIRLFMFYRHKNIIETQGALFMCNAHECIYIIKDKSNLLFTENLFFEHIYYILTLPNGHCLYI